MTPIETASSRPETSRLEAEIGAIFGSWPSGGKSPSPSLLDAAREAVADLLRALEAGEVRAAEPDPTAPGGWRANAWVKQGILLGFRLPGLHRWGGDGIFAARDRAAFGLLDLLNGPDARAAEEAGAPWRIVPGGTTARAGVHLEPGVTVMPPSYLNVGAWVGRGTLVDSHVLVGSCAQVGERVHLSAAVQLGGVLEPVGARPVVVEDDAFVGGGCGLYDGVVVARRAVLAAGVILTGTSRLVDLVEEREIVGTPQDPLVVPPGAVVVSGARPASGPYAASRGIALATPVIVKRRDPSTDARVALEEALR